MTIYELADILDKDLVIRRYANQDSRFTCQFENCETKDGGCLLGEYGDAKTPLGAIQHYTSKIRGKTLVFNAYSAKRTEFVVPKSITSPL